MLLLLSEIAECVGGRLAGTDVAVDGASIDSRTIGRGQLFVAIRAERDGHDFIEAAVASGAAAVLATDRVGDVPAVLVADTGRALTDLGRHARMRIDGDVVGITGSVGKTSVKDMVAAAAGGHLRTHASERSFNNELGVPLTLVNAPATTEVAIVEMGARGRGQIAELCAVARPRIGIVTAVGGAHTEQFRSLDEVIATKGELVEALPRGGTAVLNAEQPDVVGMGARTSARVITFGRDRGDVRAEGLHLDAELRPSFVLATPWGSRPVILDARGHHNAVNAAAAAAAALSLAVPLDAVAAGLADARMSPWRMAVGHTSSGAVIVNDAYNANPMSMEAALRSFADLPADRRQAVLGVMAELGSEHLTAHRRIGRLVHDLGIAGLALAEPAYGLPVVSDFEEATARLGELGAGDAVLVKGSRVAGLEALAEQLLAR